jgi:hypothetical protein
MIGPARRGTFWDVTNAGRAIRNGSQRSGALAHELRRMRHLSGRSLKELEKAIFVSDSSLSRYLAGRQLAPWSVVVALCRPVGRARSTDE